MHHLLRLAAITIVVAACSSPSALASPAPAGTSAGPGPVIPSVAASGGANAWPTAFDVELAGAYTIDPPFRIPLQLTVEEPGWFSGHLHDTFTDLQRFDGINPHTFPNRMLGFGDPDHVRGGNGDVDVAGLTPEAALDGLAGRASLKTSNRAPQELFGITGARMDIHSATNSNPLFGNGTDNFGLGPQLDVRLVLLPHDGRLLVVAVLAAPGDLDGAWAQAMPILETVRLGP